MYVGIAWTTAFIRIFLAPHRENFTLSPGQLLPNPLFKNRKDLFLRSSNEGWEAQVSRVSRILHKAKGIKNLILNFLGSVGTKENGGFLSINFLTRGFLISLKDLL